MTAKQIAVGLTTVREANLVSFIATKESPLSLRNPADALAAYVIDAKARRSGRAVISARLESWTDDGQSTYSYTLGHPADNGYTDCTDSRLTVASQDAATVDQWLTDASITL